MTTAYQMELTGRVLAALEGRRWQFVTELAVATGYPPADVAAALSELKDRGVVEYCNEGLLTAWRRLQIGRPA